MKIQTQPYAGQFVLVTCCDCGTPFGLDRPLWQDRQNDGELFYCPNGHPQYFTRRETKLAKEDAAYWQEEANAQAKATTLAKGQLTRLKNKVAAGECPCCHQHFPDVRDHIAAEHPDFLNDEEDTAAEQ